MAAEREDAAEQRLTCIARRMTLPIEPHPCWQRHAEFGMQQHLPPLQRRGAHIENYWPLSGWKTEAERIGPQRRSRPSRRHHPRLPAGQMDADQPRLDDHLRVVGVAPAVVTVIDA